MNNRPLLALSLVLAGPAVASAAAPDLRTTLARPASVNVYAVGRYTATVANVGNKDAASVKVSIQLPQTHTSPQVYPLGTVTGFDPRCTRANTVLNCTLGTVRKGSSTAVYVDIKLPVSTQPIVFGANAPAVAGETNTTNNSASITASTGYYNLAVGAPREAVNRHCTGTGLTSFFECELFPSSIADHLVRFETDGVDNTIVFVDPVAPGYGGVWSQPTPNSLTFRYYDNGSLVATFNGYGVDGICFEGLTTFPNSTYVSPYEVCLQ